MSALVEDTFAIDSFNDVRTGAPIKVTYCLGSLRDGGTERQVLELIRHINRSSFEPSLILMDGVNAEKATDLVEHCRVIGIDHGGQSHWLRRSPSLARSVQIARRFIRNLESDIVHAFLPGPCILAGLAGRLAGVPLIIGSRRSLPSQYRSRTVLGAWADTAAFHAADFNLGNSQAVCREMLSVGHCPSAKCGTIYNGVDLQRFRPELPATLRHQLGWTNHEVVCGMVANFRSCKRHCDFIEMAAIVARKNGAARFLMAGSDQGTKKAVLQQVQALALGDKVRVLDSIPTPEHIFAALDVYVCTSEAEGFSNVLLEAMACGKPVIATRVGGNSEAIEHGKSGFIVDLKNPQAIADRVLQLFATPILRREIGISARKRVEAEFPLAAMVRAHEDLYTRLLRERRRLTPEMPRDTLIMPATQIGAGGGSGRDSARSRCWSRPAWSPSLQNERAELDQSFPARSAGQT